MSERFFRSNRPGYPHPVSSELENSGIRVAVGDCSVTERRRWRPPYQTGKTVHVHAKHYKHDEDGRTAPGVCGNGSIPLSHSGNVVTRIGIHTLLHLKLHNRVIKPLWSGTTFWLTLCIPLTLASSKFATSKYHMSPVKNVFVVVLLFYVHGKSPHL